MNIYLDLSVQAPFFREKPQIIAIEEDKPAQLVCFAVGDPRPVVLWYKSVSIFSLTNAGWSQTWKTWSSW